MQHLITYVGKNNLIEKSKEKNIEDIQIEDLKQESFESIERSRIVLYTDIFNNDKFKVLKNNFGEVGHIVKRDYIETFLSKL